MTALVRHEEMRTELAQRLKGARDRIAAIIPRDMSADRIIGVIQNEWARNERLRECTPDSIVAAVVQSAELGLDPSPKLGQVWFIPRRGRCEMQIGYKGILKKAYECERILSVDAVLVREGDEYRITRGTNPSVHHVQSDNRGKFVALYFVARLTPADGNVWKVDDMPLEEAYAIRDRSDGWRAFKAGRTKSNPWQTDEGEMLRKTMLIRGLKQCPISDSFRAALEADADDMRAARREAQEPSKRVQDMKDKLRAPVVDAEIEDIDPDDGP